ncbi:MAG: hypothetical protein COA43_16285 [Robiginitomaculum sp.]|nr:MAG: hypothetical protein COA43_16285 [Robiginitomaculum sp.]
MKTSIIFDPLLPIWMIITITALIVIASTFGEWRGLKSFVLRTIAAFILCGALLNPQSLLEERMTLPDIALVITDISPSMEIGARQTQAQHAQDAVVEKLGALANLETVTLRVEPGQDGTRLIQTMIDGLGQLPAGRIAGVIAITDGRVHDMPKAVDNLLPDNVPFHSLIIGKKDARDRRLDALLTPKFGLVGEQVMFEIMVDDPGHEGERAGLEIRLNGVVQARFNATIGNRMSIPLKIEKRGLNTVEIRTAIAPDELTPFNNTFVSEISGVRDRLRVLLITGEPHMGGRAWRNLLKSDPSVDLVQFTILTNPGEKKVSADTKELSLIQFPERELFEEKLGEFDLVIFDHFRRRSLNVRGRKRPMLKPYYIANIAEYVERGGALLVATGPAFASEESLARSPLIAVLPARPTGELNLGPFRPKLNEKGKRHPITSVFDGEVSARWGRWYRTIDVELIGGDALMQDDNGNPLLVIDKVKKGRTAMLLSDQAWLWAKGHDGGGPYNELLRRVAHWLMGEPDLESDRLTARIEDEILTIEEFSLNDAEKNVKILKPDGTIQTLALKRIGAGHYRASMPTKDQGAYSISSGDLTAIAAVGALNPQEFKYTIATDTLLAPLVTISGGKSVWVGDNTNLPSFRKMKAGTKTANKNYAGLISNEQYNITSSRRTPIGPTWLYFLLILLAMLGAWRFESR